MDGEIMVLSFMDIHSWSKWQYRKSTSSQLRDILIKGKNDHDAMTYAILSNINKQKYTIGIKYKSRDEQGEYLFVSSLPTRIKGNVHNIKGDGAVITVVENEFWITPGEGHAVFINEEKICGTTLLKFGDYFHIIVEESDDNMLYPEDLFLFKERNLQKKRKRGINERQLAKDVFLEMGRTVLELNKKLDKNMVFSPGENALVLSHIFSYLSVPSIKNSRLVCKFWAQEGAKILRTRTFADFDFDYYSVYDEPEYTMRFFRYEIEMKNFPMRRWKMAVPHFIRERYRKYYPEAQAKKKYLEDLSRFFKTTHYHNIKELELYGTMKVFPYKIQLKILNQIQSTLQILKLVDWTIYTKFKPPPFPSTTEIYFKRLEKFTLSFNHYSESKGSHGDYVAGSEWIKSLLPSINEIKTLVLESCQGSIVTTILEELSNKNTNSVVFPRLEGVEILDKYDSESYLQLVLGIDRSLKRLDLGRLSLETIGIFEQLLRKQSPTLESLQFILAWDKNDEVLERKDWSISLPVFPKLKKLSIGLKDGDKTKLVFDNEGSLNYAHHLPSIKSLLLWTHHEFGKNGKRKWDMKYEPFPNHTTKTTSRLLSRDCIEISREDYWTKFDSFYGTFLCPNNQQICTTLNYLDIPYEAMNLRSRYRRLFPKATEIATRFPNVANKWLNAARI